MRNFNKKLQSASNLFFAIALVLVGILSSCSENKEVSKYDNWKERNESFIDSLATIVENGTDISIKKLVPISSDTRYSVYYKVKESGVTTDEDGAAIVSPYYTSKVSVFYYGTLINGDYFDGNFFNTDPNIKFETPANFYVYKLINGWAEVLQQMVPGDRWTIYIPHQLAYGTSGSSTTIPGYSTLIFDLKLVEVTDY